MTIRLSPAMEKRVARIAKARGLKPNELVEEALKAYLKPQSKPTPPESDARRRLRELTKHKTRQVDFDTAVHEAKEYGRQVYEDNIEFIELGSKRYAKSQFRCTPPTNI
jgi:hypothetical protein